MKITRRALPKNAENQYTPGYEILRDGQVIATAYCTGRPGVDNYPWNWSLADGVAPRTILIGGRHRSKESGRADTLRSAIDQVEQWVA